MGDLVLVAFGALALAGAVLILVGGFQRRVTPKLWGFALLSAGVGAWMLGPLGLALGIIVFFMLRARRRT